MDEGGKATQGGNDSEEATPEDTGEHKSTQGDSEHKEEIIAQEVDVKEWVEEAEIQHAVPGGITKDREGAEGVTGTGVDTEAGK